MFRLLSEVHVGSRYNQNGTVSWIKEILIERDNLTRIEETDYWSVEANSEDQESISTLKHWIAPTKNPKYVEV